MAVIVERAHAKLLPVVMKGACKEAFLDAVEKNTNLGRPKDEQSVMKPDSFNQVDLQKWQSEIHEINVAAIKDQQKFSEDRVAKDSEFAVRMQTRQSPDYAFASYDELNVVRLTERLSSTVDNEVGNYICVQANVFGVVYGWRSEFYNDDQKHTTIKEVCVAFFLPGGEVTRVVVPLDKLHVLKTQPQFGGAIRKLLKELGDLSLEGDHSGGFIRGDHLDYKHNLSIEELNVIGEFLNEQEAL